MGAQLNIKDAETVRLAHELADATGQPITKAVKAAIQRELRENEKARAERAKRLHDILQGARELWKPELLSIDPDDLLYDEHGLPK